MSSEAAARVHVISRRQDSRAWDACLTACRQGRVEVILIHDAVLETEATLERWLLVAPAPVVMACAEDARRRQVSERWPLVEYGEIIERCAAADQVVSW